MEQPEAVLLIIKNILTIKMHELHIFMIDKSIFGYVLRMLHSSNFMLLGLKQKWFIPDKAATDSLRFTLLIKPFYYVLIIQLSQKLSETWSIILHL